MSKENYPASELIDTSNGTHDEMIICPVCGDIYTHPLGAWTRVGTDAFEAGIYKGTKAAGVTAGWRRSALVVGFYCEQGHNFALVIQQNKGNNYACIEMLPDDDEETEDGAARASGLSKMWPEWRLLAKARLLQHKAERLANQRLRQAKSLPKEQTDE